MKPIEIAAFSSPLNFAFGAEYRDETYKIGAGDPGSRVAGPTAAIFGVGSDGFQGFPVDSAGSFSSESYAGYVDFETDFTEQLSGGIAARFEDYDEFGSTFDWKISGRYDFTDNFAMRATAARLARRRSCSSATTRATSAASAGISNRLNPIPAEPSSSMPQPRYRPRMATAHISSYSSGQPTRRRR